MANPIADSTRQTIGTAPAPAAPVVIRRARFPAELDAVRAILRDYEAATAVCACFAGFERELADLPGPYGPPAGALVVASDGTGALVGCVALRATANGAGEIKRLFVRPDARGRGAGRALVGAVLAEARAAGYRRVVLETHESMAAAAGLYGEHGFDAGPSNGSGIRTMALDPV